MPPRPIPVEELRLSATAALFEGEAHGIAASMFITTYAKGQGPSPHVHPYAEAFLVQEGEGDFIAGEEVVRVAAGNMLVIPPNTRHGFTNPHDDTLLHVVSVHPSPRVVQEPA